MAIINKGILNSKTAYLRQLGNDWPTAQVVYTADILESTGNLYFTTARVNATVQPFLTTANVIETSGNLYFTNARVFNAVTIGTITGSIAVTGNLIANGLIIRNINVQDSSLTGSTSANNIVADSVTSNIWNRLYTANVIETSGNLYFTTTRARSSFTAGQNITIDNATGTISSYTQAVVVNASDVIPVTAATTTYTLTRNVSDPKSILVINEGLIQIPVTDYNVSGTTLTTTTQYPVGTNIEVRYFGIDSTTAGAFNATLQAQLNSFTGTGSNVNYTLTSSPASTAYTIVNIDGVEQLSSAYSLNGSVLTFTEAPSNGANIEVRVFAGIVGAAFNTRTYVGNGSTLEFPVSTGYTENNILVFENGVAQVPYVDYTVNSATSNVIMVAATAANVNIQIRELGSTSANLLNQIVNLDLTTSNVIPKAGSQFNLGSNAAPYNKIYLAGANSLILGNTTVSISGTTLTLSTSGATTVVGASASTPDIISPFMLMGA
jgi:hypothetical protein